MASPQISRRQRGVDGGRLAHRPRAGDPGWPRAVGRTCPPTALVGGQLLILICLATTLLAGAESTVMELASRTSKPLPVRTPVTEIR